MSKQMPLNEYCDWLEDLTSSGDAINSKGLQNWIERYAEEYHQSKVNNVIIKCDPISHNADIIMSGICSSCNKLNEIK